jgi:glutamate-5-semialdehyde dehydrogenase
MDSNIAIVKSLRQAVTSVGITPEVIQLIESADRKLVSEMLTLNKYLDLLIPRGGASLIQKVVQEATVPVIETGVGNCHVYVDAKADLAKATAIAFNAKVQRPSVCNAAETLLVHKKVSAKFLPEIITQYKKAGVVIHGCQLVRKLDPDVLPATEEDYAKEYLGLEIAIKVVDSLDEALEHIYKYGSKHTEAIVSLDKAAIAKFQKEVDASSIMVNASTRFTDGGEFGFGCEIGISTQKLHARGPMGLAEITSYKYLVLGSGQIRK